jgi:hypothetical protein
MSTDLKRSALRRFIPSRPETAQCAALIAPYSPARRRRVRRQANLKCRPSLVIGRSRVWPVCVEPAWCGLPGRPDPRVRDRRDFGSRDCQILAKNSPHIPHDSHKNTACSLLLPSTMDNQQREPPRTQRPMRKVQIRQLTILSCCFLPTFGIIRDWRMLAISHASRNSRAVAGSVADRPGETRITRPRLAVPQSLVWCVCGL